MILGNKIEDYNSTEKESTPFVDLKHLAKSANAQVSGSLNLDKLLWQDNLPTQTKLTKIKTVNQIPVNDDIKIFQTNKFNLC